MQYMRKCLLPLTARVPDLVYLNDRIALFSENTANSKTALNFHKRNGNVCNNREGRKNGSRDICGQLIIIMGRKVVRVEQVGYVRDCNELLSQ